MLFVVNQLITQSKYFYTAL